MKRIANLWTGYRDGSIDWNGGVWLVRLQLAAAAATTSSSSSSATSSATSSSSSATCAAAVAAAAAAAALRSPRVFFLNSRPLVGFVFHLFFSSFFFARPPTRRPRPLLPEFSHFLSFCLSFFLFFLFLTFFPFLVRPCFFHLTHTHTHTHTQRHTREDTPTPELGVGVAVPKCLRQWPSRNETISQTFAQLVSHLFLCHPFSGRFLCSFLLFFLLFSFFLQFLAERKKKDFAASKPKAKKKTNKQTMKGTNVRWKWSQKWPPDRVLFLAIPAAKPRPFPAHLQFAWQKNDRWIGIVFFCFCSFIRSLVSRFRFGRWGSPISDPNTHTHTHRERKTIE